MGENPARNIPSDEAVAELENGQLQIVRRIANSPGLLLGLFLTTILTSSVLYMISEGTGFFDSVYWSLVTATTLGYGDFSPHSVSGKVLTSFLIAFTVFIMIPTITANVAAWLIVNRDAFRHEEQEQIKDSLTEVLALLKRGDAPSKLE